MVVKIWELKDVQVRVSGGRGRVNKAGWVRKDRPYIAVLRDKGTGKYFLYLTHAGCRITPAQYDDAGAARSVAAQLLALPFDWSPWSRWRVLKALTEKRLSDVVKMLVEPLHV